MSDEPGNPPRGRKKRPRKPQSELTQFKRRSIALTMEEWAALEKLAEVLDVRAPTGLNYGKPSWRTMISQLAKDAPAIIAQIEKEEAGKERAREDVVAHRAPVI